MLHRCSRAQGARAEHVYYVVHGQIRVIKDKDTDNERTLNVLGRGSCMGDWGVVNDQPRLATCVAVGDVELLMIADFNFKATVDQALLARLLEVRVLDCVVQLQLYPTLCFRVQVASEGAAEAKAEAQSDGTVALGKARSTIKEDKKESSAAGARFLLVPLLTRFGLMRARSQARST